MAQKQAQETPLMQQYNAVKAQHPDAVILFRVGDFYETFHEDALVASKVLGIVLTKRGKSQGTDVPLAGFPHHAIDTYLPKLIQNGYKVAVCDQLEDPALAKKLVKRGVTDLVTPGISYSDRVLEQKENNYLCAVTITRPKASGSPKLGAAFLDVSTGTFKATEGSADYIKILLGAMGPKEILVCRDQMNDFTGLFGTDYYITRMDEWAFAAQGGRDRLLKQFNTNSLKGFGIEDFPLATGSAGAILFYLDNNYNASTPQISSISRIDRGDHVWMDAFTIRNLEIFSTSSGRKGSALIDIMDRTSSPMGARLLRNWLQLPIKDLAELNRRHSSVEYFFNSSTAMDSAMELISQMGDLERMIARSAVGRLVPKEAAALGRALEKFTPLKRLLVNCGAESCGEHLRELGESIDEQLELREAISGTLCQEPASAFGKGDIIASGVNAELDELRSIARDSRAWLQNLQESEAQRTGINSLKVGYNNVFGYYLEVRNTYKENVPQEWIRKQTLVGAERYITQELKDFEEKIVTAQDRILVLEQQEYALLVRRIQEQVASIQRNSAIAARVDVLSSFALLAKQNNYCRPQMDDSLELAIKDGRHPVIEKFLPVGEEYVANSLELSNSGLQIMILTGPNMSGKSALLRQTALIVLMAQTGCFVPASEAHIGIVDKIFTRVGASDNLSLGESTFMVEMMESSTILHNLSERSLVLFDEIGRGTSTFDGMSIAWAIVEYLHEWGKGAKTLFATHYHELNELEKIYPRVKNYNIAVKEDKEKIIFLRKLTPGGVAHSFGIHVASIAGMPAQVLLAANNKLNELESQRNFTMYGMSAQNEEATSCAEAIADNDAAGSNGTQSAHNVKDACSNNSTGIQNLKKSGRSAKKQDSGMQLSLYQLDDPLLVDIKHALENLDINNLSPLQAFQTIVDLRRKMGLDKN